MRERWPPTAWPRSSFMSSVEQRAFERQPHAQRALMLRRADERGKVNGLAVPGLDEWMDLLRALVARVSLYVSSRAARGGTSSHVR